MCECVFMWYGHSVKAGGTLSNVLPAWWYPCAPKVCGKNSYLHNWGPWLEQGGPPQQFEITWESPERSGFLLWSVGEFLGTFRGLCYTNLAPRLFCSFFLAVRHQGKRAGWELKATSSQILLSGVRFLLIACLCRFNSYSSITSMHIHSVLITTRKPHLHEVALFAFSFCFYTLSSKSLVLFPCFLSSETFLVHLRTSFLKT
jgi:hypothetical protein